jgi:DNA topoisomerase-1
MPPKPFTPFKKNSFAAATADFKKRTYSTSSAKKTQNVSCSTPPATAKWLVIVESPSKCKKIEEYLGPDYHCVATKGHLRSIDGLKSIDTKNGTFEPKFSIIKEKESQVSYLNSVIGKFSKENVILASDDDREGEAIAWHICQVFDLPVETTSRIVFHEITKKAVQEAVANPVIVNMKLVHAQHARQVLDMIVGFKISPFLWKYVANGSTTLSAGRCQTPALRLVYDNEKARGKENLAIKYKTTASFTSKQVLFELTENYETELDIMSFLEASKTHSHILSVGSPKESSRSPPRPFHTSNLLQTASNVLHIGPKEVMQHCQELYQNGHITYMRTESSQYSKTFLEMAKEFLLKEYTAEYLGDFNNLENKNAANPHEAIRVTDINRRILCTENNRRNSVYQLIWRNTVESCMSPAVFQMTKITIPAAIKGHFEHTVEVPLFLGWKRVAMKGTNTITEEQNTSFAQILWFRSIEQSRKPVPFNWINNEVCIQKGHSHYTEASLIQKLEEMGIGRPSTFASIVETLFERGYVKKKDVEGSPIMCKEFKMYTDHFIEQTIKERVFGNEKNKLVIEPVGITAVEFLTRYFLNLFSYEYTKNMEAELDLISNGEIQEWSLTCRKCHDEIKKLSKTVGAISKEVYPIDEEHSLVFNKFGPTILRKTENEDGVVTSTYLPVKKGLNIDLDKWSEDAVENGDKYSLDDLVEIKNSCLGSHNGEQVMLKTGRYGLFVEWGADVSKSIKHIKKEAKDITLEDVIPYLEGEKVDGKNILRVLNSTMSIRKGRFGPYAYYKTAEMEKPQFLNIKKFPGMFSTCDKEVLINWLCDTHGIEKYKGIL